MRRERGGDGIRSEEQNSEVKKGRLTKCRGIMRDRKLVLGIGMRGRAKWGGRVMLGEKMERRKEGDETEEVNSNISGKHSNKSASF